MSFENSATAISVVDLSKSFYVFDRPSDRLARMLWAVAAQILPKGLSSFALKRAAALGTEKVVLKNVSFNVPKGTTCGIIGRNGAGKSTLLQIICGTLAQSGGSVHVNGKVAALLELGSGFNPDFTGIENVYFNAQLLGLSRPEIDSRLETITEFADIGDYVHQPVSTYSSGMFVRLAFAVAIHVDASILIIDEALSVGDAFFQQKCMRKLREFQALGGTILFVSHDMSAVTSLCESAILLYPRTQKPPLQGNPELISRAYLGEILTERASFQTTKTVEPTAPISAVVASEKKLLGIRQPIAQYAVHPFNPTANSDGTQEGQILDSWIEHIDGSRITEFTSEQTVVLKLKSRAKVAVDYPAWGFMVKDRTGQFVFTESSDMSFREHHIQLQPGEETIVSFVFKLPVLIRAEYFFNLAFAKGIGNDNIQMHWIHDAMQLTCIDSRVVHGIAATDLEQVVIER
jgi:lipopolysaccharide transport system ATP-binding protein